MLSDQIREEASSLPQEFIDYADELKKKLMDNMHHMEKKDKFKLINIEDILK